jgi:hypothetical protein
MQTNLHSINLGLLFRLDVTIEASDPAGNLNLDAILPSDYVLSRVFTKYTSDSEGQTIQLKQDGGVILDMGENAGVFTTFNENFIDGAMLFDEGDSLSLEHDTDEIVSLKIYGRRVN